MGWLLHHALVAPEGQTPAGWALFLHGILGSGPNWRTMARRLVAARPDWGAVLVDLRMHGRSQDAAPPHTLAAVAGDLQRLAAHLEGRGMRIAGVIGHSFGGKSALTYRATAPEGLVEAWVLDSSPSARKPAPANPATPGDGAIDVLHMLRELPGQFSSRAEFLSEVTGRGFSRPLAEWLSMNLASEADAFRFRLDLAAIGELMADYHRQDAWPAVESAELPGRLRFVVAGRSASLDAADRERLAGLAARGVLDYEVVDAGHWLHIEAADELVRLFTERLTRLSPG